MTWVTTDDFDSIMCWSSFFSLLVVRRGLKNKTKLSPKCSFSLLSTRHPYGCSYLLIEICLLRVGRRGRQFVYGSLMLQDSRRSRLNIDKSNHVSLYYRLFDITCVKTHRFFAIISSLLTSFPDLIATRSIPLSQQLYTTSLTSAFCTLAHCRQRARSLCSCESCRQQKTPSAVGHERPFFRKKYKTTLTMHEFLLHKIDRGEQPVCSVHYTTIQVSIVVFS